MSETTQERRPARLTELEIPAPDGKRARAYDADYVDSLLSQAQDAIDSRSQKLEAARKYVSELEARLAENETVQTPPASQNVAEQSTELLTRAAVLANEHVREAETKAEALVGAASEKAGALVAQAEERIANASRDAQAARAALIEQVNHLAQVRDNAVRDLEGLLGGHLSSLRNYVRQNAQSAPAPEAPAPAPEQKAKPVPAPAAQPVQTKPETPVAAPVADDEDGDGLDEL